MRCSEPCVITYDVETEDDRSPFATRHDLQLGRRFFHMANGVTTATAYALFFTHEQVVHVFGAIACIVYVLDRIRIAYPEFVAQQAPWINRTFVRAEETVRESAMIPFAIAVLLTILTLPKMAALVAIYTLAIADPLAAIVGIRFGRRRLVLNRTLEGSLAFFAATTTISAVVFEWGIGPPEMRLAAISFSIGLLSAVFELIPLRLDDNLTIPLFVGSVTWFIATVAGVVLI